MHNSIYINCIYPAFQGEVNFKGIGHPVIFVRTQGCHLRCYKETLGTLCDTPEGLEGKNGGTWMKIPDIINRVNEISEEMGGTKLICLTGGDPLWRSQDSLHDLFYDFYRHGYEVSVETSGTLSIKQFRGFDNVHWVLDYKLKSAGIKKKFIFEELFCLDKNDFIKFVVYDEADYAETKEAINKITTNATLSVGTFWNGKIGTMQLFNMLKQDNLLGTVTINVQLHKMAFYCDAHSGMLEETAIPAQI